MQHIEFYAAIYVPRLSHLCLVLTQNAILAIGGAEDKVHGKEILAHVF
jgi:cyanophycinase-like exopeptidase